MKFVNSGVGVEDLISIGTIGLIKAINSYDRDKNIKLATYASRCIENEKPPQVLKGILGHSTLSMTMDLYAHVLPDTKAKELQKIANLF